jgi:adenosylmethionine-8-amino-7-oxononanoate aminotransferase
MTMTTQTATGDGAGEARFDGAAALLAYDVEHVVHMRYKDRAAIANALIIDHASGSILYDVDGNAYLDATAQHHNVNLGHCHPALVEAAHRQLARLGQSHTTPGFTHVPLVEVTEAILRHGLPTMASVFYCSIGAEAVEATMKFARYYQHAVGQPAKSKFITLNLGYHGNTFATLAACGRDHDGVPALSGEVLFPMFQPLPSGFVHVAGPYDFHGGELTPLEAAGAAADALEAAIVREGPDTIAAFLYEPIQGHNFHAPDREYFVRVRQICDRYDILMIADEMITGFGRTGRWWSMEHFGVEPDITSFGKGITSGHVPLSGAILSQRVWDVVNRQAASTPVEITNTYSGHPVPCAVGLRNIEVLEHDGLVERSAAMGELLRERLAARCAGPGVFEIRGLGLVATLELRIDPEQRRAVGDRIAQEAFARGVLVRVEMGVVGPLVTLTPPLVVTDDQLDQMVAAVGDAVDAAPAVSST